MNGKFKDPQKNPLLNPVDWFNLFGDFATIFQGQKNCELLSDVEAAMLRPGLLDANDLRTPTYKLNSNGFVHVLKDNPQDISTGSELTKFMLLTAVRFKGSFFSALSFVSYELMKNEVPYIRVGTDYYKRISKRDRYGATNILLKPWKKDEIKSDHGNQLLQMIYKYDDFTILPNNKTFQESEHNCYNLYSKFPHEPTPAATLQDIPVTINLIQHVFGDQWELGLRYLKVLYEYPTQILPALALVSVERETGKTTFLNWFSMLFGQNSVLISPNDITNDFNSSYATKNIIMIDETALEKSHAIEKIKSITTAKSISVNQKHTQQYSIPFFGKIILCTNKERDFMRIDKEEIRFWVRKINPINGNKNTNIESDLFNEIPAFLRVLIDLPEIDFTRSRMVFTREEIETTALATVKEESSSWLKKDLTSMIEDYFNGCQADYFHATPTDIKLRFFGHHNQVTISWITKVLREEFKMEPDKMQRYSPFNGDSVNSKPGKPFYFLRRSFTDQQAEPQLLEDPF